MVKERRIPIIVGPNRAATERRDRDPDLVGAEAAIHGAAQRARRRAARNGTPIAVYEDGKIVWMRVNEKDLGLSSEMQDATFLK